MASANNSSTSFSFTSPSALISAVPGDYAEHNPHGYEGDEEDEQYYVHQYLYEQLLEAGFGVSIKGQGIKLDSDADAKPLLEAIQSCHNMKYLELEGNTLGIPVAKSIGKLLESHTELEIALWKDLFTGRLKDEIPKALNYLLGGVDLSGARLQRLDLSDNAIGPVGMPALAPFFRTPSSFGLKELIVSNQGLGPEGGSTFAAALIDCYNMSVNQGEPFQLKVFICGRNRLENKAATKFAEFFSLVGSLEEIHLPQNGINPPGIKALASAFKANPNLRILNLNDNTIRPDGCLELAGALAELHNLEELNLGDCLLKNDGVLAVLNGIPKGLNSLMVLNFESNELTKTCGLQVAEALRTFPNLYTIHMGVNEFGVQTSDEMNNILMQYNSSGAQIDFEDDTGSGNEEEESKEEGEEGWESFKEEGEGDEHEDEGDDDEGEEELQQQGNEFRFQGDLSNVSNQSYQSATATPRKDDFVSSFLSSTSICSPALAPSSTTTTQPPPQISNNNLFTFGPSFSFSAPTFGITPIAFGSNANSTTIVEEFIKAPHFPNYVKLTPEPGKKIIQYLEEKYKEDKVELSDQYIGLAVNVSNIVGSGIQTQDCFNELMIAALKSSINSNAFITSVLVHLGLIHGEDKPNVVKAELVTDATVQALAGFLGKDLAPVVCLRCAQEFFKPNTPAAKSNVKIPARNKLLTVVNDMLSLLDNRIKS